MASNKFTFDGTNRIIYILEGVTTVDVKSELYSDWSDWYNSANNAKFPIAFEAIGGWDITDVQRTTEFFFLVNDWVLYHDTGGTVEIGVNLFTLNENKIICYTSNNSQVKYNNTSAVVVTQDDLLALIQSIKNKVDLFNFIGQRVVATLDGEQVDVTDESAKRSQAKAVFKI